MTLGLGDFNGHVGKQVEGFQGVHGGNGIGERNEEGRLLLEFCDEKELCVANTWFRKKEQSKVTYRSGGNETEIDFIVIGKHNRKYIRDVKMISGELQHGLVVADIEKRRLKKRISKPKITRRRVWKLKEKEIRLEFQNQVGCEVDTRASNLWEEYRNGVINACDDLCGKKLIRRSGGNTWWWNDEVKEAICKKKEIFKELCKNQSEENKIKYRKQRNLTRKVVAKAMKREAEKELENLRENPNTIFKLVKRLKKDGKDVEGGRCLRGKDGRLGFTENQQKKIWKDYMENIMNIENDWDHVTTARAVEGPIEKVSREEIVKAIKMMKPGKASGPSEVSTEMIIASGEIGIQVMLEICQRVLDGLGIPAEWKTSVLIPIFKGRGDVMDCSAYRGIKLLEHVMNIVEKVLKRRIRNLVHLDKMLFGFMHGKGTSDAIFILRRMQEAYLRE